MGHLLVFFLSTHHSLLGKKLSSPWLREETNGTLLLPSLLQLESHMSQESSVEASINVS